MTSAMFAIYCNLWSSWPIFERWWQNMTPYQWSDGQALSSLVKGCESTAHNHRHSRSSVSSPRGPIPKPEKSTNAAWCNALLRSRADLLDTLSTGCSQGCTSEESLISCLATSTTLSDLILIPLSCSKFYQSSWCTLYVAHWTHRLKLWWYWW